jgi:hypothetical protein
MEYPDWFWYPPWKPPEVWVAEFIGVVRAAQAQIGSTTVSGLTSDRVLAALRPGLEGLGYQVESGKHRAEKIRRPVLFGERGKERVSYEIDGVHDKKGIVLEIEAGRGARGNAVYRDLVRTSLIVGARFLVLGVMSEYRHKQAGKDVTVASFRETRDQLDAIFASGRLGLPFEGVLLFGY